MNKDSGITLETGGRSWVYVKPSNIWGLINNKPFNFNLIAKVPQEFIPSNIPDGVYEGSLQLMAKDFIIEEIPVILKVTIPRFIFNKKEITHPCTSFPKFEKTIYYPGNEPHVFKIPIWSTSINGVQAKISLEDTRGIEYVNGEEKGREEYVKYALKTTTIKVPGKESSSPGYIYATVRILDNSLNGKNFVNYLFISGDKHREAKVLLITNIRFISQKWKFPIVGTLLILSMICFWLGWKNFSHRNLWRRRRIRYRFTSEEPQTYTLQINHQDILKIEYNGNKLPSESEIIANDYLKIIPAEEIRLELMEEEKILYEWFPLPDEIVEVEFGENVVRLRVQNIPTLENPYLSLIVDKSSFGSGRSTYFWFGLGIILIFFSGIFFKNFYLPFKLIDRLLQF